MQINSITNKELNVTGANQRAVTRPAPLESGAHPSSDLDQVKGLARELEALPDVRPEVVSRGRELYQEVPYPPTEIVTGISRLVARFWENT